MTQGTAKTRLLRRRGVARQPALARRVGVDQETVFLEPTAAPPIKRWAAPRLNRGGAFAPFILAVALLATACTQTATMPKITLSSESVARQGHVEMKGSGFSPKASIISHLRRPNGTDASPLRILTDSKGEFTHNVEALTLLEGTHELWVVDSTGASSNVVRFEVEP